MTKIEWTDRVWNPARGCSRISEGCRHCYAETMASRFSDEGQPFHSFATRSSHTTKGAATTIHGPRWTGRVELLPDKLGLPLRWRRWAKKFAAPCPHCTGWVGPIIGASQCATCGGAGVVMRRPRVFVNSMSDLFHEKLSNEDIAAVFGVMAACPGIDFQVLTKRPERMLVWFEWASSRRHGQPGDIMAACLDDAMNRGAAIGSALCRWPLPNVWLGVSVENRATTTRILDLLRTPAAVRFVSYEPALEVVEFTPYMQNTYKTRCPGSEASTLPTLEWLIVGGESGPGARPCDIAWIRSAVQQCRAAGVACFVKQLGARPVTSDRDEADLPEGVEPDGEPYWRLPGLHDRKGGDPFEWPEDLRVREFPS